MEQIQTDINDALEKKFEKIEFVGSRHGIGYLDKNKEASLEELRESREFQDLKEKNKYLEEHVLVLEQGIGCNSSEHKENVKVQPWYKGTSAHKIYSEQSKGNLPTVPSVERARARKPTVPKKKYGYSREFELCSHCGGNWHKQKDFEKLRKFSEEHAVRRNSKSNDVNLYDFYDDDIKNKQRSSSNSNGTSLKSGSLELVLNLHSLFLARKRNQ